MMEQFNNCNHHLDSLSTVSLFIRKEDHIVICENCFLQIRDEWQAEKLRSLSYDNSNPCELCRSSDKSTRFDEEYHCYSCFNCLREHQLSFNEVMLGRQHHNLEFDLPTEILEGLLYLGSHHSSISIEGLKMLNIRQIIVCCSHLREFHASTESSETEFNLRYHRVPLSDSANDILSPDVLSYVCELLKAAEQSGIATLVHCYAGISRSASICIAWLMKRNKWTYAAALEFIKSKRPIVFPNPGFVKQLIEWESIVLNEDLASISKK